MEGNSKIYCPEVSYIALIHGLWQYVIASWQLLLLLLSLLLSAFIKRTFADATNALKLKVKVKAHRCPKTAVYICLVISWAEIYYVSKPETFGRHLLSSAHNSSELSLIACINITYCKEITVATSNTMLISVLNPHCEMILIQVLYFQFSFILTLCALQMYTIIIIMVALCNSADHYIFALWFLSYIL